jgi:hypothetical protein
LDTSITLARDDAALLCVPTRDVVVIPVANVDRAKGFQGDLGWRADADTFARESRLPLTNMMRRVVANPLPDLQRVLGESK